MKKLLSLVLAFAMLLSVCVLAHGEEAAQKYDLKGMTVKVRNWDTPNPYAAETDQVDKDKWLPIYEAAKAKYNCEFEFYNPTVELWYITLPNMKPQLLFGAVMSITGSLSVADITVALNGFSSTNYATHTIINHLNDYGIIRLEMGYACAIAVLLFFIMLGLNVVIQKWIRKVGT